MFTNFISPTSGQKSLRAKTCPFPLPIQSPALVSLHNRCSKKRGLKGLSVTFTSDHWTCIYTAALVPWAGCSLHLTEGSFPQCLSTLPSWILGCRPHWQHQFLPHTLFSLNGGADRAHTGDSTQAVLCLGSDHTIKPAFIAGQSSPWLRVLHSGGPARLVTMLKF